MKQDNASEEIKALKGGNETLEQKLKETLAQAAALSQQAPVTLPTTLHALTHTPVSAWSQNKNERDAPWDVPSFSNLVQPLGP